MKSATNGIFKPACPSCGGPMGNTILVCHTCYWDLPASERIGASKVIGNKDAEASKVTRWVRVLKEKREKVKS